MHSENGCKIQNVCDGLSGIMLCLKLVKSAEAEATTHPTNDGLNHGSRVILYLIHPWAHTLWSVVGDSYFASVMTDCQLHGVGLWFIVLVPNNTAVYHSADLQQTSQQRSFNQKGRYYF